MNSSIEAPCIIVTDQDAELHTSLIKVLLYFDIFNHPLSKQELRDLIPMQLNEENHFSQALQELTEQKQIYFHNGFYSISPSVNNSQRRIKGEERAGAILKRMQKFSGLIASFPFVKELLSADRSRKITWTRILISIILSLLLQTDCGLQEHC